MTFDSTDPDLWSVVQFIMGVAGLLYPPVRDWVRSGSSSRPKGDTPKEIIEVAKDELREDAKSIQLATRSLRALLRENGVDENSPFELDGVALDIEYFTVRQLRKLVKSILSISDKTFDDSLEVEAYLHQQSRVERPEHDETGLKDLIHRLRNAKTFAQAFDLIERICELVYELLASSGKK